MQKILHLTSISISALLCLFLVGLQPFPLLHDYLEWMYQGWLFSELLIGGNATVTEQFTLVSYPVPNSVSQVAIGFLNIFVSPIAAGKIWLALYFLLSATLWWLVAEKRSPDASGAIALLLTLTISLGAGFWNGYANFQFGLLFFGYYLYYSVLCKVMSVRLVLLFSLLLFFCHAAVYAAFVAFVFIQFVLTRDRWSALIAVLPSLVLLFWYTSIKLAGDSTVLTTAMSWIKWAQYKAYTIAKQGPFHNFILHDGESLLADLNPVYLAGFAMNFAILFLMLIWLTTLVWKLIVKRPIACSAAAGPSILAVTVTPVLLILLFLGAGSNSFGVVNLGERFLVIALMMSLMFFEIPVFVRQVWVAAGILCAVLLVIATSAVTQSNGQSYAVARSTTEADLEKFVDDIYANSRHKYFNHRLFIYADRGQDLQLEQPQLLPIDLATSIVIPRPWPAR